MDPELLEAFNEEAAQNLTLFYNSLAALQNDPGNKEAAGGVYRAAHTMVGIALSVGFDKYAEVAKPVERMVRPVRDGEKTADAAMLQLLGECYSAMHAFALQASQPEPQAPAGWDALVGRLAPYRS